MSDNKFDNYLRDRLLNQVSPVPADMWQRIHPDKQHPKRILWIWWLIGPAIILSGLYIGYRSSASVATPSAQNISSALSTRSNQNTTSNPITQSNPTTSFPQTAPSIPSAQTTLSQPNHTTPSNPIISSTLSTRSNPITHPYQPHLFNQTTPPTQPIPTAPSTSPIRPGQSTPSQHPDAHPLTSSPITLHIQRMPVNFNRRPSMQVTNTKPSKKSPPPPTSNWFLDAYASPDWPLNHDGRLSYTAGFRLNRTFGPHFTGAIGIQYSDIRERNTPGDSLHIPYKLDLKTLDIPLLIGYRTRFRDATASITAGVIFNIHSWEKIDPVTIGNVYKTNTGLSLYFGINYTRPLSDKLSLFAEPYIRYRLSNMTDYPYSFPKKIHVAGLSLGLRYNFSVKSHIYRCP